MTFAHDSQGSSSVEPLGLMVHSLPSSNLAQAQTSPVATGRWKLLALVLLCSLPVFAAYWVYFVVRPQGQAGLGQLVQPVQPMPDAVALGLDGRAHPLVGLRGQWLLVSVAGGACGDVCQRRLFVQRQLRAMLGKDKDRVDWVWLVNDAVPVDEKLRPHLAEGRVLALSPGLIQSWLAVAPGKSLTDYIFVVDPLGNVMMRFPAQLDAISATKARRDLERLLRASASWDGPGR